MKCRYESSWPALSDDTNGVIFVFNPNEPSHPKELNQWLIFYLHNLIS